MSEKPLEKTTRKLVNLMTEYPFHHQATVYLDPDNTSKTNVEIIKRLKRLITEENPDNFLIYQITRLADKETGEIKPVIFFRAIERIAGKKVRRFEAQSEEEFKVSGTGTECISTPFPYRYDSLVAKLKREKLYDLDSVDLPSRINRIGVLNAKNRPVKSGS